MSHPKFIVARIEAITDRIKAARDRGDEATVEALLLTLDPLMDQLKACVLFPQGPRAKLGSLGEP